MTRCVRAYLCVCLCLCVCVSEPPWKSAEGLSDSFCVFVLGACIWVTTLSTRKDLFTKCILLLHNLIPEPSALLPWYKFKMSVGLIWLDRKIAWWYITIISGSLYKPCLYFCLTLRHLSYIHMSGFYLLTDVHAKHHKNAGWVVQPCWGHMLITWSKE